MIGSRFGSYEILSRLGAGGMGEVYRATDTKLKRQVAIKILPPAVAADVDRLARFQREAEVLASLNHPNIAAIHGLEESGGTTALVMELVEGEDLSTLIGGHPSPEAESLRSRPRNSEAVAARGGGAPRGLELDESLPIAKQIAEALEAAHEQGIVHRDLKPANIKVRADGTVKVLDFGLAKAMEAQGSGLKPQELRNSPTLTSPAMTHAGMILGTAAYMAPEQARGKAVDKRADIWAFGCVLYEMLTGRQVFEGDDVADVMSRVLQREPDLAALPANTPAHLRALIARCLVKDPRERLRDVGDARLALGGAFDSGPAAPASSQPSTGSWRRAVAAFALGAALVAAAVFVWRPTTPDAPETVQRFRLQLPQPQTMVWGASAQDGRQATLAISADGLRAAFVARDRDDLFSRLLVQKIGDLEASPLAGTDAATNPFFSPDGQWIGFQARSKLMKIPAAGGAAEAICDAAVVSGATWLDDGTIVFAGSVGESITVRESLLAVPATGGTPKVLTTPADGEAHRFPEALPGTRSVFFTIANADRSGDIALLTLDSAEPRIVVKNGVRPLVRAAGYLLFGRPNAAAGNAFDLYGVKFDARKATIVGAPVAVLQGVQSEAGPQSGMGAPRVSLSATGTLLYREDLGLGAVLRHIVLVNRDGTETMLPIEPASYEFPRVSPDGQRILLAIQRGNAASTVALRDIWLYDLARQTLSRLTFEKEQAETPDWTDDGARAIYAVTRGGARTLVSRSMTSGVEEPLGGNERHLHVGAWVPQVGGVVAIVAAGAFDPGTLWWVKPGAPPSLLLRHTVAVRAPTVSRDGRWLAYAASDTGRSEVYVRPLAESGAAFQVSSGGGAYPRWSKQRTDLFYFEGDRLIEVSIVNAGNALRAGRPSQLFHGPYVEGNGGVDSWYDVMPDGQFIMLRSRKGDDDFLRNRGTIVATNWIAELRERVH